MAQPGSALPWGGRGRRFESSRADQNTRRALARGPFWCFEPSFREDSNLRVGSWRQRGALSERDRGRRSRTSSNPDPVWRRRIRGPPLPPRLDAQPEWARGGSAGRCRSETGDGEAGPVRIPTRCGGAEYGDLPSHPGMMLSPSGLVEAAWGAVGARPAHGEAGCVRIPTRCGGASYGARPYPTPA